MGGHGRVCILWLTKVATAAQDVGVRVLAVQAINEPAKRFSSSEALNRPPPTRAPAHATGR